MQKQFLSICLYFYLGLVHVYSIIGAYQMHFEGYTNYYSAFVCEILLYIISMSLFVFNEMRKKNDRLVDNQPNTYLDNFVNSKPFDIQITIQFIIISSYDTDYGVLILSIVTIYECYLRFKPISNKAKFRKIIKTQSWFVTFLNIFHTSDNLKLDLKFFFYILLWFIINQIVLFTIYFFNRNILSLISLQKYYYLTSLHSYYKGFSKKLELIIINTISWFNQIVKVSLLLIFCQKDIISYIQMYEKNVLSQQQGWVDRQNLQFHNGQKGRDTVFSDSVFNIIPDPSLQKLVFTILYIFFSIAHMLVLFLDIKLCFQTLEVHKIRNYQDLESATSQIKKKTQYKKVYKIFLLSANKNIFNQDNIEDEMEQYAFLQAVSNQLKLKQEVIIQQERNNCMKYINISFFSEIEFIHPSIISWQFGLIKRSKKLLIKLILKRIKNGFILDETSLSLMDSLEKKERKIILRVLKYILQINAYFKYISSLMQYNPSVILYDLYQ